MLFFFGGVLNFLLYFIHPSSSCFPKYVPDSNEFEDNIPHQNSRSQSVNRYCECGVKRSARSSNSTTTDSDLVDPEEYPWHVLIQMTSSVPKFCGGTIINDMFIITSVSCFVNLNNLTIAVNLLRPTKFDAKGITVFINVKNNQELHKSDGLKVESIYCHFRALPSYITTGKLDYDVCMLQLAKKLHFDKVSSENQLSPVCLPVTSDLDIIGRKSILLGWQPGSSETNELVKTLRQKKSWIFSPASCGIDNKRLLCSQYGETKDIFQFENEGSPVLVPLKSGRLIQVGLSSWKYIKGSSNFDSVPVDFSTNLSTNDFISFINEHSERAKASWCQQPVIEFPEKSKEFKNTPSSSKSTVNDVWDQFPSTYRRTKQSCKCGIRKSLAGPRIVGGHEVLLHEYGWQVQLQIKMATSTQGCGATIINSKMILTASHCVVNLYKDGSLKAVETSDITVNLIKHTGFSRADNRSKSVTVSKIFSHPHYYVNYTGIWNDIALLELTEGIDFESLNDIRPVCLPSSEDVDTNWVGKFGTVIGYGLTNETNRGSHAKALQELDVPIHDHKKCVEAANLIRYSVPEKAICAGHLNFYNYKDPSHGDSGGPLMISRMDPNSSNPSLMHMVQIGLVSAGTYDIIDNPKDEVNTTALWYSSVSGYLSYIDFFSYRAGAVWCSW